MLELSILALIVLAGVYWTALWLMGRHEDVLYGDFVTAVGGSAGLPPPPAPEPPPLLVPPEIPRRPRGASLAVPRDMLARPAVAGKGEITAGVDVARSAPPVPPPPSAQPSISRPIPRPSAPITAISLPSVGREPKAHAWPPAGPTRAVRQDKLTSITAPPMVPPRPAFISQLAAGPRQSAPPQNDVLASLLETIKRDLGDAVSKQR
ncbi:hypothetical protein [Rhodopseudomonas sp. B29]|uniref:hypothetical protein n=1 Tax=Rhodopseudomonas sp. B29 TaxID=95607 RepID=UPI0003488A1D|nr:hypothetical protein [Rhodopseudomonas sp. B29]